MSGQGYHGSRNSRERGPFPGAGGCVPKLTVTLADHLSSGNTQGRCQLWSPRGCSNNQIRRAGRQTDSKHSPGTCARCLETRQGQGWLEVALPPGPGAVGEPWLGPWCCRFPGRLDPRTPSLLTLEVGRGSLATSRGLKGGNATAACVSPQCHCRHLDS